MILLIWKVLVPYLLKGYNPIWVAMVLVMLLTVLILSLIYGLDRRCAAAVLGAALGILVTAVLGYFFTDLFRIHGTVMESSESLLYAGYAHLDLTKIFVASIFLGSSGAVMDLSVDICSAVYEVVQKRPEISAREVIASGFAVGRAACGSTTTTLLLAYSGSYVALMMVFMAQGTPVGMMLNYKYVAAEIVHTVVGSFGLVTVAPLTAITSGLLLIKKEINKSAPQFHMGKKGGFSCADDSALFRFVRGSACGSFAILRVQTLFQRRLLGQYGVDFVVKILDHDLGLQINLVVVLGAAAILFLLTVLAHHDERRLNGRDAGQHQIQQDERIRVERTGGQQGIYDHPQHQPTGKREDERPAAREFRDRVRRPLAEGVLFLFLGGIDRHTTVRQQRQHLFIRHILLNIPKHFLEQFSIFLHGFLCPLRFIPRLRSDQAEASRPCGRSPRDKRRPRQRSDRAD